MKYGFSDFSNRSRASASYIPARRNYETHFTRTNGSTGAVGNVALAYDPAGYAVDQTVTTDGSGNRTVVSLVYAADGSLAEVIQSVTSADGSSITTSFDTNADGVFDRIQTVGRTAIPCRPRRGVSKRSHRRAVSSRKFRQGRNARFFSPHDDNLGCDRINRK